MTTLPYVKSVINIANGFSHASRPKQVGQMSDLIQEYRNSTCTPTEDGWRKFYYEKIGSDKIQIAANKTWEYIQRIKENLNSLTQEDVYEWEDNLIITKTWSGLQIQLDILEMVCGNDNYRLATPKEESQGIDGFVDGEPVSIKPNTYKKTIEYGKETIPYRIIFYKKTKKGLVVV